MNSTHCDRRLRFGWPPRVLIGGLVGVSCFRVGSVLSAGDGSLGGILAFAESQWLECAASLILLALLDWSVRTRHPGLGSLCRRYAAGALAGTLLQSAAAGPFPLEYGAAIALSAAVMGLLLTLVSALLLEWLVQDLGMAGPPPAENESMARLADLEEIARSIGRAARAAEPGVCERPVVPPACGPASALHDVVANGVADQLSDRMEIKLLHDVGPM